MPGKVRLDSGIEYECPPEVEAAYNAVKQERTDAVEKLTAETAAKDALQAKHDALAEEVEKLKKVDNAGAIAEGVKARSALLAKVKPMLSEEDAKKADEMSDKDLQVAAIQSQVEKFDAEGKSDDYLAARFDAAVESFEEAEKTKKEDGKTVIGDGSKKRDGEVDLDDSRQDMMDRRDGKKKDKE